MTDNNRKVIEPVSINEEDYGEVRRIQGYVDSLSNYRKEVGRIYQLLSNLTEEANAVEVKLAEARRELVKKYDLENQGDGQWSLDFDNKEFVKLDTGSPVIP